MALKVGICALHLARLIQVGTDVQNVNLKFLRLLFKIERI